MKPPAEYGRGSHGQTEVTSTGEEVLATLDAYFISLAENARDAGIARIRHHDPDVEWWHGIAELELDDLIATGEPFTSDAITPCPSASSAVGGLILSASKAGRIECVGITRSKRIQRHAGALRVWRAVNRP